MEQQQISLEGITSKLPITELDTEGKFKYVLILAEFENQTQYFVRGYKRCSYHADVFAVFINDLAKLNYFDEILDLDDVQCGKKGDKKIRFTCTGGGRIEHTPDQKKIFVYGYSQGFGLAKHSITTDLIKQSFQNYPEENITWSNEGY